MCYREVEILKEEINNLQGVKTKLNTRIKELEDELKKTKEELEKKNTATKEGEEEVQFNSFSTYWNIFRVSSITLIVFQIPYCYNVSTIYRVLECLNTFSWKLFGFNNRVAISKTL